MLLQTQVKGATRVVWLQSAQFHVTNSTISLLSEVQTATPRHPSALTEGTFLTPTTDWQTKPGGSAEPASWRALLQQTGPAPRPEPGTERPGLTEPKAARGHPGLAAGGRALAVGAEQEDGWGGRLPLWPRLSDIQSW